MLTSVLHVKVSGEGPDPFFCWKFFVCGNQIYVHLVASNLVVGGRVCSRILFPLATHPKIPPASGELDSNSKNLWRQVDTKFFPNLLGPSFFNFAEGHLKC